MSSSRLRSTVAAAPAAPPALDTDVAVVAVDADALVALVVVAAEAVVGVMDVGLLNR